MCHESVYAKGFIVHECVVELGVWCVNIRHCSHDCLLHNYGSRGQQLCFHFTAFLTAHISASGKLDLTLSPGNKLLWNGFTSLTLLQCYTLKRNDEVLLDLPRDLVIIRLSSLYFLSLSISQPTLYYAINKSVINIKLLYQCQFPACSLRVPHSPLSYAP